MYIPSGSVLRRVTRVLIALLLVILLFIPIVICSAQDSLTARMAVVAIAASLFIGIVSIIIEAKSIEIFMAGATYVRSIIPTRSGHNKSFILTFTGERYVTILVVFVAGTNPGRNS